VARQPKITGVGQGGYDRVPGPLARPSSVGLRVRLR
jgi:hypothetical protein